MQFFMPMIPPKTTAQQHQVTKLKSGKIVFYDPPKVAEARGKLTAHLACHRPPKPYTGGVRLTTKWCFPTSKSQPDEGYLSSKPDTDNLQKMLKDIMTRLGFWTDDCLVASEIVEKFTSNTPGIFVKIEELQ